MDQCWRDIGELWPHLSSGGVKKSDALPLTKHPQQATAPGLHWAAILRSEGRRLGWVELLRDQYLERWPIWRSNAAEIACCCHGYLPPLDMPLTSKAILAAL
jgi:hypothetical protein